MRTESDLLEAVLREKFPPMPVLNPIPWDFRRRSKHAEARKLRGAAKRNRRK